MRRVLLVCHAHVVPLNRRLARELRALGVEAVAVAPRAWPSEWGTLRLAPDPDEPPGAVRPVALRHAFRRFPQFFRYGPELDAVLDDGPWDAVHVQQEPYTLTAFDLARRVVDRRRPAGRPAPRLVFATFQNIDKTLPFPFPAIERAAIARAHGWLPLGHTAFEAKRRVYLGPDPDRPARPWRVVPPGVDVERFRPDPRARARVRALLDWSEPGPPVVGYVGRFVPEKGLAVWADALERLHEARVPLRALFVGAGPAETDLRARLDALRARDRARDRDRRRKPAQPSIEARVAPPVPHHEVPDWMAALDLLVVPSLTTPAWREQFGRVLVEAMAAGVPVVASDSGEIPRVLADTAPVVPENDPEALALAVAERLESPDRRAEQARAQAERARNVYAWPVVARANLEFLNELPDP